MDFILTNFNNKNWKSLFFGCNTCAIPIQYQMKINSYYVKRALINVLRKVVDTEYEELPETLITITFYKNRKLNLR